MRKTIAALGVIFIFVGVLVMSISTKTLEKSSRYETVGTSTNGWEVRGYFQKMENLVLTFTPPSLDIWPDVPVYIEIWPEEYYDKRTVFQVEYKLVLNYPTVNISLVSNEGGLIVSEPLSEVEGVAVYEGYYWANITIRPAVWNPLPYPKLEVKVIEKEYPFLFLLPIGVSLFLVGIFSFVWGIKTKRKALSKKKFYK